MFKKTFLSAAVAALISVAHAQPAAPANPAAPAAPAAAAAMTAVAQEAAPRAEPAADPVNPFLGRSAKLEVRQRELETAKIETALLEERMKQASLAEDLKTIPLKKSVEAAQATTARLKEEALQKEGAKLVPGAAPAPQAAVAAQAAPKPKARPAKKAVKEEAAPERAQSLSQIAPKVEVTSVLSLGGVRSAVLDIDGNTLSVKHGDSTPMGAVEVLDSQSVRIGGRVYKVHGSTLARIMISDPKIVDPNKPGAATPAPVVAMGAPVASSSTLPPPASFGSSSQSGRSPTLPPLQLPSGVTLIPPASSR